MTDTTPQPTGCKLFKLFISTVAELNANKSTYHGSLSDETSFPVSSALQFSADTSCILSPPFVSSGTDTKTPNLSYLRGILVEIRSSELRKMGILNFVLVDLESFMCQWPFPGIRSCVHAIFKRPATKLWVTLMLSLHTIVHLGPTRCFSGASLDLPGLVGYLELLVWTLMTRYHWQTWRTWSGHSEMVTPPSTPAQIPTGCGHWHATLGVWLICQALQNSPVQSSDVIFLLLVRVALMYL